MSSSPQQAAASTTSAAKQTDWIEILARFGYSARGAIYLVIGLLALLSAFGQGGQTTDSKGAISRIFEAPGGWILVLILALGLIGYSVWRFCQGILDTDHNGTEAKGWVICGGLLVSAVTHLLLAFWAGKLALGELVSSNGGGSQESMIANVMSQPAGQWLVGLIGLAVIGAGVAQFLKGHDEKFEKRFTWDADERRKFLWICKTGLYVRGVVFAIIGSFIVYAAYTTNPSDAGGLAEAMQWVRSQPFGPWLLALMAIGLACFGVYSVIEAIYRRVNSPT